MTISRRDLLALLQIFSSAAVLSGGISARVRAEESEYSGRLRLEGDPHKARVLILGAGLAGLTAAFELRNAGYQVQVLEYNSRAGGRSRSSRPARGVPVSIRRCRSRHYTFWMATG